MHIALTGSSGLVGTATAEYILQQGDHSLTCIDVADPKTVDDRYRFIKADLTSYQATLEALRGADAVIHVAGFPAPGVSSKPSYSLCEWF